MLFSKSLLIADTYRSSLNMITLYRSSQYGDELNLNLFLGLDYFGEFYFVYSVSNLFNSGQWHLGYGFNFKSFYSNNCSFFEQINLTHAMMLFLHYLIKNVKNIYTDLIIFEKIIMKQEVYKI